MTEIEHKYQSAINTIAQQVDTIFTLQAQVEAEKEKVKILEAKLAEPKQEVE